jgi:tRNA A-37 threonylcarbamoyl transferase component Bud32
MASTEQYRTFLVTCYAEPVPASELVEKMLRAPTLQHEGRAGIRILEMAGKKLACRKYTHGGLFRAFTRDLFFSAKRSSREAEIMLFLKRGGFPVITPFATITELGSLRKKLYLCTILEEGALNLREYLKRSEKKARLRAVRKLAELFWELERAGIYHPDLHLKNVMVTLEGNMLLLDFDRASRKPIGQKDVESIFWRLARYADKMQRQAELRVDDREKAFFLRTYERLSKRPVIEEMKRSLKRRDYTHRIGWWIESFFYGSAR